MDSSRALIQLIGFGLDTVGVLVVAVGALFASARLAFRRPPTGAYRLYRHDLGRAILLGLEFLVAGDIIRTVVLAPTLDNVEILGLIVLIRTFLSMALQLELEGRWPWQKLEETVTPEARSS